MLNLPVIDDYLNLKRRLGDDLPSLLVNEVRRDEPLDKRNALLGRPKDVDPGTHPSSSHLSRGMNQQRGNRSTVDF